MRNLPTHNRGSTIIELLFYIILFAMLSLVVINSLIVMTKSFKETTINKDLSESANILERISRDVKGSYSIQTISATSLKLNTADSVGANKTVQFSLSGTNIQVLENDVLIGNINSSNISVTALSFTQITTAHGTAVKVSMTTQANRYASTRTADFYDTLVLRGDY